MDRASQFSEGLAGMISPEGKWGYIDRAGRWAIPPQFVKVDDFWGGLARVILERSEVNNTVEETWGYINRKGEVVWRSGH